MEAVEEQDKPAGIAAKVSLVVGALVGILTLALAVGSPVVANRDNVRDTASQVKRNTEDIKDLKAIVGPLKHTLERVDDRVEFLWEREKKRR